MLFIFIIQGLPVIGAMIVHNCVLFDNRPVDERHSDFFFGILSKFRKKDDYISISSDIFEK